MKKNENKGMMLIQALVFGAISIVIISAIVSWAGRSLINARYASEREQAFYIAEAGIEYYRWHLAHAQQDFKDGTATTGPYIHSYYDSLGNEIGSFSLSITPPPSGSTVVTIVSEGRVNSNESIKRSIEAKLAIPSLAKYAFVANVDMRFGEGTEVFGALHSNAGIRFDGIAHNLVTSALSSYNDPDHYGSNEFAVHTHVSPTDSLPPSAVPNRPDVFAAGRQFPVPAVDFNGFTTNLASMKTKAQSSGRYISPSGDDGYLIVLKTNDTFDLYKINSLNSVSNSCQRNSQSDDWGWGSLTVNGKTLLGNYPFPENGIIFVEDNTWVEGQINTARVTVAAGRFPENLSTNANITVNNNLRYTNYDSQDVLALVAQRNINIGLGSANDLRIDAALLAKNGRAGRYHYSSSCGSGYVRNSVTLYGMIGSNERYGFAYTDNTGYQDRIIIYDAGLLYAPPPDFPLASDQYTTISWREL